ncbi:MAG TPA: hypothetical protein VN256_03340 [Pyrinomonadaceae bacterium]|nr:hypothetical protein [Pyrinomonadaceae bacterium]
MKICPACQKTYDDAQNFCLEDGTTLVGAPQGMPPQPGGGYSRNAAPTEVLQGTPTGGYQGPTSPPPSYSPPPPQWATPEAKKRSPLPWILVGALGLIAAVVGVILATRGSGTTTTGGGPGSTPTASPGRTTTPAGQAYNDPNGRFSVTLPTGYPSFTSQKQTQPTLAGPIELNMLLSEKPEGAFVVGYSDFPESSFEGRTPKKMLEDGRDGSLRNIKATLEKQEDITVQGRTGLAVYGSASTGAKPYYVRFNFILDKPRAYQVGYMGYNRADLDKPEVQAFFDSFRIKESKK